MPFCTGLTSRLARAVFAALLSLLLVTGCTSAIDASAEHGSRDSPDAASSAPVADPPPPGSLTPLVEPDQGLAPVYALIASARSSLDMVMYELSDPVAVDALRAAAQRGVAVRVVLDANRERAANSRAFEQLKAGGVRVVWAASRYAATHEKAVVVDHSVAAVMTLNLVARYYASTRDFGVIDRIPADVAVIDKVFDADFRHATVHVTGHATGGDDLVWSPGASAAPILQLVKGASASLLVENEEMASPAVTAALIATARRGVRVTVVMTDDARWHAAFAKLAAAHVEVRTLPANAALYIHAKAIVADASSTHARAFVGSENFSTASLQHNRELGVITSDRTVVTRIAATVAADAASATAATNTTAGA